MSIHISLVIATYNRAQLLGEALASVAASNVSDWKRFEVVVVDNNSPDDTAQVVANVQAGDFPCVLRYLKELDQGVSSARNRGARDAVGHYIAFMDDDQRIHPEYLALIDTVFEATGADVVGGPLRYYNGQGIPSWVEPLLEHVGQFEGGELARQLDPTTEFLRGGNLVVRKSQFLALGGFDVNLGRTGQSLMAEEEADFQCRLHDSETAGAVWYSPQLIQYHYLRPSRLKRNYWRQHHFDHGRSEYRRRRIHRRELRQRTISNLPVWMLRQFIVRELPNYVKALRLSREERFAAQLKLFYSLGKMSEARNQSK